MYNRNAKKKKKSLYKSKNTDDESLITGECKLKNIKKYSRTIEPEITHMASGLPNLGDCATNNVDDCISWSVETEFSKIRGMLLALCVDPVSLTLL